MHFPEREREREREQHAEKDLSLRVERLKKQQSLGGIVVVAVEREERRENVWMKQKKGFPLALDLASSSQLSQMDQTQTVTVKRALGNPNSALPVPCQHLSPHVSVTSFFCAFP